MGHTYVTGAQGLPLSLFIKNMRILWTHDFQEELMIREALGKRLGTEPPVLAAACLYWGPVGYSLDELNEGYGGLLTRMSSLRSRFTHGGQ